MKAVIFNKLTVRGNVAVEEGCLLLALNQAEYEKLKGRLLKLGFREASEEEKASMPTPQNPPKPAKVELTVPDAGRVAAA